MSSASWKLIFGDADVCDVNDDDVNDGDVTGGDVIEGNVIDGNVDDPDVNNVDGREDEKTFRWNCRNCQGRYGRKTGGIPE